MKEKPVRNWHMFHLNYKSIVGAIYFYMFTSIITAILFHEFKQNKSLKKRMYYVYFGGKYFGRFVTQAS